MEDDEETEEEGPETNEESEEEWQEDQEIDWDKGMIFLKIEWDDSDVEIAESDEFRLDFSSSPATTATTLIHRVVTTRALISLERLHQT